MKELRTESLENLVASSASASSETPGAPPPGSASVDAGASGAGSDASQPKGGGGGTPPNGSQSEVVPGTRLGKYKIIRRLGEGGMSAVFEAVHVDIHKPVAIKVLSNALAQQEEAQVRFLREAASASRLQHPHVVDVSDFGTEAGRSYLVMELMRGEDLSQHIQRRGPMPVDALADVMLPICAGVQAAHDMKIVHRDLKPQNIFLCKTSMGGTVPKVLDFGISKVVDAQTAALTHSGMMMGTPYYLSPEQIIQNSADHRSDQYALGVILYECATGRRPHEAETLYGILNSITQGSFPRPRAVKPDLDESFEALILRTLAQDASRRFPSVHALGRALLAYASERQRVIWHEYYANPPATESTEPQPPAVAAPGAKSGATEILSDVNRGAPTPGATRMLPEGMHLGSNSLRLGGTGAQAAMDAELAQLQRRKPTWLIAGGIAIVLVGGGVFALTGGEKKTSAGTGAQSEEVSPAKAETKPPPEPIANVAPAEAPKPVRPEPVVAPVAAAKEPVAAVPVEEPSRRSRSERSERRSSGGRAKPAEPATAPPQAGAAESAKRKSVEKSGGVPILE